MGSKSCVHRKQLAKSGCLVSLTVIRDVFVINIKRQGFTLKRTRFMAFFSADGKTRRTSQVPPLQIMPNLLHPKRHSRFHIPYGILKRLNISISKINKRPFISRPPVFNILFVSISYCRAGESKKVGTLTMQSRMD
jgi:hypothetical protein